MLRSIHDSPSNQTVELPKHPKIRPIPRQYYIEDLFDEKDLQRKLRLHSKALKNLKSAPNHHNPSSTTRFFKFLKAQDSPSKLEYQLAPSPSFEKAYSFSKLRGLSSLASLKLEFLEISTSNISLKVLLKSLTYLKNLTHLQILFHSFSLNKKILRRLFVDLQRLPKMKHLSLVFTGASNLKESDFRNIVSNLNRLDHLRSFQFNLDEPKIQFKNLTSSIPKLKKLVRIKLTFPRDMRIQSRDLHQLFLSFKNLKELSDISLNLRDCKITTEPNIEPLSQGLNSLDASLIKKLQLFFSKDLDDPAFLQISRAIKRFTNLTLLDLHLCQNAWISSQRISELGFILKNLASLSCLTLEIPFISKEAFNIGSLIKPLENLTDLKVRLIGNYATEDRSIQELASGIEVLKTLKCLHIQFSKQSSISEEAFGALVQSLKQLILLRDLTLKFESVDVLTNKKAESLSNSLQRLENLLDLCLNFGVSQRIDNGVLPKITQTLLKNLPNISSLELGLQEKQIANIKNQEEQYKMLFGVLKERKNVRQITLHLNSLKFLVEEINNLQKLKHVKTVWKYSLNAKNSDSSEIVFRS